MAIEMTQAQFDAMNSMLDLALYSLMLAQQIKNYDDAKCDELIAKALALKSSLDSRLDSH